MVLEWLVGIPLALLVIIGLFVLVQYNRMVRLRNHTRNSWGNVDTELQRRHELVPNLVAAVKGSAKHERTLFEEIAKARAAAVASHGDERDERRLVAGMDRLLALAEAYPRLKASTNFLELQQELALTEDRIAAARRFHNGNVRAYLDQTRQFPGSVIARLFRFVDIPFYEVPEVRVLPPPKVRMGRMGA